jgi:uncharacterized protein (DUF362 family)
MSETSRRRFLGQAASGLAMAGAIGLSQRGPLAHAEPRHDAAVQMSIAKWQGDADPAGDLSAIAQRVTEHAVAGMGGMARFVKKGDTVWLKPNIAIHAVEQFAANTNPDVVATLCRLCLEAGAAKVKVGDTSAYGAAQAYPMSGIEAAVKAAGGEMVYLTDDDYKLCAINGEFLKEWKMCVPMMEADLMINVPIVKHHALTGITIGIKNLMGVAHGTKESWHKTIDVALADITAYLQPPLTVMDAVRALIRRGPKGGDMKDVAFKGLVAVATDIVALDAAGAELIGQQPAQNGTLRTAHRRGLGTLDFRSLSLQQQLVNEA